MVKLVKEERPNVVLMGADKISANEKVIMLHKYGIRGIDEYIIFPRGKSLIFVNKDLDNAKELKKLIEEIMQHKYLNNKLNSLLDEFAEKTSKNAEDILLYFWHDWREARIKRERHDAMQNTLKNARKRYIHRKAKKFDDEIEMAFNIGYGLYEEEAKSNWREGAKNAFMYGYLMALQERETE